MDHSSYDIFLNVSATRIGNTIVASLNILIWSLSILTLPQVIASDNIAPLSLASYSSPVLIRTV